MKNILIIFFILIFVFLQFPLISFAQEFSSSLTNDLKVTLNDLNDIKNNLKERSKLLRSISKEINLIIKKFNRFLEDKESRCIKTPDLILRLQAVISKLTKKSCNTIKSRNCFPSEIVDEFLPGLEESINEIESLFQADNNENETPDICEEITEDINVISSLNPLQGYPSEPLGKVFKEEFNNNVLNQDLWEIKDGYDLWDSFLVGEKTFLDSGNLKISTNANDKIDGMLKVGGIYSDAYYSYGTFTIRAKANSAQGTVSSFYLYNEDKDRQEGGRHEEVDIELSSKFPTNASLVTFHNDNWVNDELQNEMHRGGLKDISTIPDLENFDSREFNTYVIEWIPNKITWFVNGIKVEEFTDAIPTTPMLIHIDSHNSKEWDFVDPEPLGNGSFEIDFVNYEPDE